MPEESTQPEQKPDVKPEEQADVGAPEGPHAPINIKVAASTGETIWFKIKRSTKLGKLKVAYANKVGKDVASIRFLYDGNRVQDIDTPHELEMDEEDTIDVMVEQVGGSLFSMTTYVV